jgi:hypothetical protein
LPKIQFTTNYILIGVKLRISSKTVDLILAVKANMDKIRLGPVLLEEEVDNDSDNESDVETQ